MHSSILKIVKKNSNAGIRTRERYVPAEYVNHHTTIAYDSE